MRPHIGNREEFFPEEHTMIVLRTLLTVSLLVASARLGWAACKDEQAVADARAQVHRDCDCAGAPTHGAFVRCAVGIARQRAEARLLPPECKGTVKRCAARSTCGRPGFVTCCVTTAAGEMKCKTRPSATHCTPPDGGSACVGAQPSCCDACPATGCTTTTTTTLPPPPCGNGTLDPGEECDDGNIIPADGCDPNCTRTRCGNGVTTVGEECDDGNLVDGDGCSAQCRFECGNGVLDPGEACDDGNRTYCDGCSVCRVDRCGDGLTCPNQGEQCDSGFCRGGCTAGGFCCDVLCNPDCTCPPPTCGDCVVDPGEECDDPSGGSCPGGRTCRDCACVR
jgi:cysteine-rich repeat protein